MRSRHISIFAIGILVLMLAVPAVAEEPADEPKLVLVLSGGGARGFAHVGVLRVLEELHIAPDLIVGTSMGSIVGGLYAAGWSPDDIEAIIEAINWHDIFTDRVDRKNRAFRRKQDDQPVMIQGRLHFDGFKPVLPSGVIDGQRLEIALHIIETLSPASTDFDNLPIPFRAVAANIATGEAVVIDSGELATALRASMSIPGALPPVMVNGQELVDGGIAANLPVGIAKSLGATQIIAVDISSPLLAEDHQQFSTFMSVFTHLNSLLTVGNRERDTALLGPEDLLIVPDLGDITFISFDRAQDAIAIGEEAARRRINKLQKYVATKPRWAQFNRRTRADGLVPIQVDRIRLENTSLVDDRLVGEALTIDPPANLDWNVLGFDLLELYNDRYFGVIAFHVDEVEPEVNELVVDTPPPAFGRGSIQFGLGFKDDFAGDSSYHLQVRHQYLPANRRGGEWETLLQLGTVGGVRTTYYQPLDWGMRWFVEPSLSYERGVQDIWLDGQAIAEYEFRTTDARLAAGRVLGRWGELRLAAFIRDNRGSPRIGSPEFQSVDDRRAGGQALFRIDTRDSVVFPQSGSNVHLDYTVSSETLGSETEFEQFWGSASYAWTFGKNTLLPAVEYGTNLIPAENFFSAYFIGGLFRLSGLGNRELFGEKIALARMVAYRRLFSFSVAGSGIKIYAGLSLEAGNAYFPGEDVTWGNTLKSGSIFVGGDTFIGPIIFAYGRSEGNRDRIYLGIGDNF